MVILIVTVDAFGIFNDDVTDITEINDYIMNKYNNDKYDNVILDNDDLNFSNTRVIILLFNINKQNLLLILGTKYETFII
jgi:hypothetical protein